MRETRNPHAPSASPSLSGTEEIEFAGFKARADQLDCADVLRR